MLNNYFINRLNSNQRSKISYVIDNIRRHKSEIPLYGFDFDDVKDLIYAILLDNPDLYYCILQLVNVRSTGNSMMIDLKYCDCNIREFENKYQDILKELDKQINDNTTDQEIIKIVYDYLGHNVDYDTQALREYQDLNLNNNSDMARITRFMNNYGHAFTVYGAVVDQRAVCMGFAMLFKMILNHYGIPCACLPGDHKLFENGREVARYKHMINVVQIGDDFAYVDASKALFVKGKMICYDYFLMPKCVLDKYFVLDDWVVEEYECNTFDYSILHQNNLIFTSYHQLRKYLFSYTYNSTKGVINFYYNNNNQKDKDLTKLIDDVISRHCGADYRMVARRVFNGFGNCLIERN